MAMDISGAITVTHTLAGYCNRICSCSSASMPPPAMPHRTCSAFTATGSKTASGTVVVCCMYSLLIFFCLRQFSRPVHLFLQQAIHGDRHIVQGTDRWAARVLNVSPVEKIGAAQLKLRFHFREAEAYLRIHGAEGCNLPRHQRAFPKKRILPAPYDVKPGILHNGTVAKGKIGGPLRRIETGHENIVRFQRL